MTPEEKTKCIQIKACYGLENLHFYRHYKLGRHDMHCKYISDPNDFTTENELDLQFILNALTRQQGHIYFDDLKKVCVGMDQLKFEYLIMKLAGI